MAFKSIAAESDCEQVLPAELVRSRMSQFPGQFADVTVAPGTICSYYQGGLLLFDPDTLAGRICFFEPTEYIFHNLYRLLWVYIAQVLGEKGACFLHAAALVQDKKAYLFLGNSGSGKSTIARLCSDGLLYSDDGPVFLKQKGVYRVYPSPYRQVNFGHVIDRKIVQTGAEPAGLYFIHKHRRIFLEKMLPKEALSIIIKQHIHFFVHLSPRAKALLFDLFSEVCDTVSAYNLFFYKSGNVWKTVTASESGGKDDRQKGQRQNIQKALRTASAV